MDLCAFDDACENSHHGGQGEWERGVRLGMDASLPAVVPEKVKNKLALEFDFSRDKVQVSAVLKEKWVAQ